MYVDRFATKFAPLLPNLTWRTTEKYEKYYTVGVVRVSIRTGHLRNHKFYRLG